MIYPFKTQPFPFQHDIWRATRDKPFHALFLEQGTGKTKITIDTVAWLYHKSHVENLLVIAPNGVHENWIQDEIPKHLPDDIPRLTLSYRTSRATTKKQKIAVGQLLSYKKGLAILAMSYDSFMTKAGKKVVWAFMKRKKLMYVLDESTRIKNPKAARTKSIMKSSPFASYKRILSGTPVANSPFDIWAPLNFLDPTFWETHHFSNFYVFKNYFGIIVKRPSNLGHSFDFLTGYRNLDELHKIVESITTRITKKQVLPDLPPKLYTTRYFELSPEQRTIYDQVEKEFLTVIGQDMWTMELALVRLLRLQQITCGYLPKPEGAPSHDEPYVLLPGVPARLNMLKEIVEDISTQGIIWARFTKDIDLICEMLGTRAVRYDGAQNEDKRLQALKKFRAGKAQWFVGNAAVGGEGLTITEATTVIYYNNSFKFSERLQSEDRAHRIGQTNAVSYIDLVALDTVDQLIIDSLLTKQDLSNIVTGDSAREWLIGSKPKTIDIRDLQTMAIQDALNIFNS